jgi:hypothetical protein
MDKFAAHLAFSEGARGKVLVASSVMSYFRNVKNWLLDAYPQCKVVIEERVLEVGRILEKYCKKRDTDGPTKLANACTKTDLARLIEHLFTNASTITDYQDAALLSIMWYVFGRASDLSIVKKDSVSVCFGAVLFIRLTRVKTSEQQGLSLYPDDDFRTCPVLALAIALAVQTQPCEQLLETIKPSVPEIGDSALQSLPLMELLTMAEQAAALPLPPPSVRATARIATQAPGIHNQVNRDHRCCGGEGGRKCC